MYLIIILVLQLLLVIMSVTLLRITKYRLIWFVTAMASGIMVIRSIIIFVYKGNIPSGTIMGSSISIIIPILVLLLLVIAFFIFYYMYKTRIKLETTLVQEQKKSNKIFDLADVIIVNYNSKGIITEINKRGCEILDYNKDELIGKNWFETVQLPENIDLIKNKYARIIDKKIQNEEYYEQIALTKTGKRKNIAWHSTMLSDDKDNLTGALCSGIDVTHLKHVEDNLLTLSTAIEQSPSVVVITDLQGNIEYVNPKFTELTGYKKEEVLGKNPGILKSGHFQDKIYKEMWDTISSGEEWRGEFHNRKKNGDLYWEAASISSIKDSNGNLKQYLAVKEDITEQKRIEEALEKNEKRLIDVQKAAHIGTWEWDSTNNEAFWSDENYRIMGLEPGKIKPSHELFRSFIHPDDRDRVFKAADNSRAKHKENNEIFRIILKDGTEKYVNDWSYYSYNADGKLTYSTGMMQDITEQKKIEDALKKSEERLIDAQKIAHIGTWEWNALSNKVYWSDENFRILGMEPGEIEPAPDTFKKFIHPDDMESVLKMGKEARDNHTSYNDIFRLVLKDGTIKHVNNWGTNFYNKKNKHLYTTGMMQDITYKVESEESLKSSLEEKDALLRELYHRTKNNMQVISAMLNLSASKLDDSKVSEVFTDLNNRIQSMSMVHEKLYQSQNLSSINLKDYIMDLCFSLEASYHKSDCIVSYNFDLEDVSVLIDAAVPLGLIINELVSNSFKHAFPGREKGEISIKLNAYEDSGLKIEISDSGIGAGSDFNTDKLETIGLQTVFAIGKDQLHGDIKLDTSSGFMFSLEFRNDAFKTRI